jgi:hypothetical protein
MGVVEALASYRVFLEACRGECLSNRPPMRLVEALLVCQMFPATYWDDLLVLEILRNRFFETLDDLLGW